MKWQVMQEPERHHDQGLPVSDECFDRAHQHFVQLEQMVLNARQGAGISFLDFSTARPQARELKSQQFELFLRSVARANVLND